MNDPIVRLVTALEQLVSAESIALRSGDVMTAAAIQGRASPVIAALAAESKAGRIPATMLPRLRLISERRQENQVRLAGLKALRLARRFNVDLLSRRLGKLKPAYAKRRARSTFCAAG